MGRLRKKYSGSWEHYIHSRAHSHSVSETIGGGGKRSHRRECVRVCVSTRPAVTAPSSWARGLPAPGRCVGRGRPATPRASPAGEGPPRAPDLARPCPTCPGELGRAPGRERKALPLGRAGRSGAAEDKEEEKRWILLLLIQVAHSEVRQTETSELGARKVLLQGHARRQVAHALKV